MPWALATLGCRLRATTTREPSAAADATTRVARRSGAWLLYAAVQFLVLTAVGMILYPGGAKFDRQARHYLFFGNFFSDLGASTTPGGRDNALCRMLFVVALGSVGLALLAFAPTWRFVASRQGRARWAGFLAQGCGWLSALAFIGIGVTPWNLNLELHNDLVQIAFSLLLGFVAGFAWVQLQNAWPALYLRLNAAYLAALVGYVYLMFRGPSLATPSGFAFQVVAQKVIAYVSILNLGLQGFGLRRAAMS